MSPLKNNIKNISKQNIIYIIFAVLTIFILALCVYFYKISQDYKNYNSIIKSESEVLKSNLDELNKKYQDILTEVDISQKDKMSLLQALSQVGVEYNSLMQNYNTKITEVDKLQKTVSIDDELLKKYSKYYFLNENYAPSSTAIIDPLYTLNAKELKILTEVKPKLESMLSDAKNANIKLVVNSAYRSFAEQKGLKGVYVQKYGLTKSNQFSADQGYSEHQLGTTVDITDGISGLSLSFDKTASFAWMRDNAHKYGFILSYPKNNTYYIYEPWHYRFVGVALATYMHDNNKNFYDMEQGFIDGYKIWIFE